MASGGPAREDRPDHENFRTQFGDARVGEWLIAVGVAPRKSLSLAAIDVAAEHVRSLTRGLLDGVGSIGNHSYRTERHGRPGYAWTSRGVAFSSSREAHDRWLQQALAANLSCAPGTRIRVHRPSVENASPGTSTSGVIA